MLELHHKEQRVFFEGFQNFWIISREAVSLYGGSSVNNSNVWILTLKVLELYLGTTSPCHDKTIANVKATPSPNFEKLVTVTSNSQKVKNLVEPATSLVFSTRFRQLKSEKILRFKSLNLGRATLWLVVTVTVVEF